MFLREVMKLDSLNLLCIYVFFFLSTRECHSKVNSTSLALFTFGFVILKMEFSNYIQIILIDLTTIPTSMHITII